MITNTEQIEEWRSIAGYEGLYEVSSLGRVRSYCRRGPRCRDERSKNTFVIRKAYQHKKTRYSLIGLSKNCKRTTFSVHRIVCIAFHGTPPTPDHQVNHRDGDKGNNCASNLEWMTCTENMQHAWGAGLYEATRERVRLLGHVQGPKNRGAASGSAILTESQVVIIKSIQGLSNREIAERYGVSDTTIRQIRNGRTWSYLNAE